MDYIQLKFLLKEEKQKMFEIIKSALEKNQTYLDVSTSAKKILEQEIKNRITSSDTNFIELIQKAKNEMLPAFEMGRIELEKTFNQIINSKEKQIFIKNIKDFYETIKKQEGCLRLANSLAYNAEKLSNEALSRGIIITSSLCNLFEDAKNGLQKLQNRKEKHTKTNKTETGREQ